MSVFFIGFLAPGKDDRLLLLVGVGMGVLIALIIPTSPNPDAGRWGGVLWQVAAQLPVVADRSLAFLLLCPLGGAALLLWLKRTWADWGGIVVLAVIAFATAHTANSQVWQRYYEPFLLGALVLLAGRSDTKQRWALWPLAVLAFGLAGIAVIKVYMPLM